MIDKNDPKLTKARLIIAKPFLKVHPNILTGIGALFAPLFFYCLTQHMYMLAIIAYICSSFDAIDGIVARATDKVTRFGELLDATVDRMADGFIITAFGFAGLVRWELIITLLVLSFMVSYISARAGESGKGQIKIANGIISLQDRRVILFLATLCPLFFPNVSIATISLLEWIFILLCILSVVTIFQRMQLSYRLLK